ncbi:Leptin receptor [Bagarius yarrelli]|uniref:Leptin receptor n=1 Tax=Bagarius yarrelli TaxID=175774 RepID=A0A556VYC5_BAGYA|nr:Leptin receptor [Bagarius yarrelli]
MQVCLYSELLYKLKVQKVLLRYFISTALLFSLKTMTYSGNEVISNLVMDEPKVNEFAVRSHICLKAWQRKQNSQQMFLLMRLFVIVNVFTALHAAVAMSPSESWPGVYQDMRWRAHLCCTLISFGKASVSSIHNESVSHVDSLHQYECHIQKPTNNTEDSCVSQIASENTLLDISCWLEDNQDNAICHLKLQKAAATDTSHLIIYLQQVVFELNTLPDESNVTTQVQCPGEDEITCFFPLYANADSVSLSVNGFLGGHSLLTPEMRISTSLLRKPDAPCHLRYNVTTKGEVIIAWNDSQNNTHPLYYELRYSPNTSLTHWQVVNVQHPWVSVSGLTSGVRYTIQVRCKSLHHPQSWSEWSNWSQPFYLTLDVSYIPAEVFTRPGVEVTVYSVFHNHSWNASKAVWMLNGQMLPESQYRMINEKISAVTIRSKEPGFNTLMCCYPWGQRYKCSIAYTKIYVEGFFDANITCQTYQRSRVDSMTCTWNKSAWAVIHFLYRGFRRMCEEIQHEESSLPETETMAGVKECPDGAGDYRECTLRDLSLLSCYKLWLVVEGGHNKVKSLPVFVSPIDFVKPSPPSDLEAVTLPNKTLSVSWKRPHLPAYDLQYELHYVPMNRMADIQWKPLPERKPASCVQGFVVVHQTSGGNMWSDDIDAPSSFYTFQWREEVHSVTVMSRNSLGSSAKNSNMTLMRQPKRQCVHWFYKTANASCVFLSWSLVCEPTSILSFVLEWMELSGYSSQGWTLAGRVEWIRIASTARDLQLCRPFYGTEEFKLYPVFVDGEGEPVRCTAVRGDPAAYMLLMIIAFLFVVLIVTLMISQNQLKKLMWKDVPNPNNCSWAKGMDFKKLDGNLFGHQEGLTAYPLLPMSENVCEVEIVRKLSVLEEDHEKKALLHYSVDPEIQRNNLSSIEGSLDPLSLDVSTVAASPETSGQSNVTYSTILVFDQPVLQRKPQESFSSSSDEGNFSANNSDISGSFPGGLCELESHSSDSDGSNPRNSCSYNSVEEFSETSEQEDEVCLKRVSKVLYYMGMDEEEEEEDELVEFKQGDGSVEQNPYFSPELDLRTNDSNVPLYLPQFQAAAVKLMKETAD